MSKQGKTLTFVTFLTGDHVASAYALKELQGKHLFVTVSINSKMGFEVNFEKNVNVA